MGHPTFLKIKTPVKTWTDKVSAHTGLPAQA